jgi:hypothetical protein
MIEYQELIDKHQALQKRLDEQPDTVEIEQVLRLVADVREAGAHIGNPQDREQLRAILRHWGAYAYRSTGEFPATQLAPYEGEEEEAADSNSRRLIWGASPWRRWLCSLSFS